MREVGHHAIPRNRQNPCCPARTVNTASRAQAGSGPDPREHLRAERDVAVRVPGRDGPARRIGQDVVVRLGVDLRHRHRRLMREPEKLPVPGAGRCDAGVAGEPRIGGRDPVADRVRHGQQEVDFVAAALPLAPVGPHQRAQVGGRGIDAAQRGRADRQRHTDLVRLRLHAARPGAAAVAQGGGAGCGRERQGGQEDAAAHLRGLCQMSARRDRQQQVTEPWRRCGTLSLRQTLAGTGPDRTAALFRRVEAVFQPNEITGCAAPNQVRQHDPTRVQPRCLPGTMPVCALLYAARPTRVALERIGPDPAAAPWRRRQPEVPPSMRSFRVFQHSTPATDRFQCRGETAGIVTFDETGPCRGRSSPVAAPTFARRMRHYGMRPGVAASVTVRGPRVHFRDADVAAVLLHIESGDHGSITRPYAAPADPSARNPRSVARRVVSLGRGSRPASCIARRTGASDTSSRAAIQSTEGSGRGHVASTDIAAAILSRLICRGVGNDALIARRITAPPPARTCPPRTRRARRRR